jgi:hypothetical protein
MYKKGGIMKYFSWLFLAMIGYGLIAFIIYGSASKEVVIFNQQYNCDYSVEEWIFNKEEIKTFVNRVEPKIVNVWIETNEE